VHQFIGTKPPQLLDRRIQHLRGKEREGEGKGGEVGPEEREVREGEEVEEIKKRERGIDEKVEERN